MFGGDKIVPTFSMPPVCLRVQHITLTLYPKPNPILTLRTLYHANSNRIRTFGQTFHPSDTVAVAMLRFSRRDDTSIIVYLLIYLLIFYCSLAENRVSFNPRPLVNEFNTAEPI